MKHACELAIWLGLFALIGFSSWLGHVEKIECIDRGGTWVVRGACSPDSCEVSR